MSKKLGLALSGGGYRAAAFHLGTLKKLNELNVLNKVDVISSISGGSIIGAYYCTETRVFSDFEKTLKEKLENKNVIGYVLMSWSFIRILFLLLILLAGNTYLLFTSYAWTSIFTTPIILFLLIKYQFKIFPISKEIEKAYDNFFYNKKNLSDLIDRPELAIGSTNVQSCRPFTFSKRKMEDSFYAYMEPPIKFKNNDFPISRAVVASSCVPFAFSPVSIDKSFFKDPKDFERVTPILIDGGVYDNQGIQKITQKGSSYECDIIITSDAGNKLPFSNFYNNTFVLLLRTVEVFMARIKNFQMAQNIYTNANYNKKEVAYLSLGWDIESCIPGFFDNILKGNITTEVIESHKIPSDWLASPLEYKEKIISQLEYNVDYSKIEMQKLNNEELKIARNVSTNLSCLSDKQIDYLIRFAENMTELQVKLYCPSLIN